MNDTVKRPAKTGDIVTAGGAFYWVESTHSRGRGEVFLTLRPVGGDPLTVTYRFRHEVAVLAAAAAAAIRTGREE